MWQFEPRSPSLETMSRRQCKPCLATWSSKKPNPVSAWRSFHCPCEAQMKNQLHFARIKTNCLAAWSLKWRPAFCCLHKGYFFIRVTVTLSVWPLFGSETVNSVSKSMEIYIAILIAYNQRKDLASKLSLIKSKSSWTDGHQIINPMVLVTSCIPKLFPLFMNFL